MQAHPQRGVRRRRMLLLHADKRGKEKGVDPRSSASYYFGKKALTVLNLITHSMDIRGHLRSRQVTNCRGNHESQLAHNPVAVEMRRQRHGHFDRVFRPGDRILDFTVAPESMHCIWPRVACQ